MVATTRRAVHPTILHGHSLPDELIDQKTIWKQRYRSIGDLEEHLHRNGTQIVKIFLQVIACSPLGLICVAAVPGPVVGWAPRGSASVGWAR